MKGGCLEKYPFFDWHPTELFEKWLFYMFMSTFAKNNFGCMIMILFTAGTFD